MTAMTERSRHLDKAFRVWVIYGVALYALLLLVFGQVLLRHIRDQRAASVPSLDLKGRLLALLVVGTAVRIAWFTSPGLSRHDTLLRDGIGSSHNNISASGWARVLGFKIPHLLWLCAYVTLVFLWQHKAAKFLSGPLCPPSRRANASSTDGSAGHGRHNGSRILSTLFRARVRLTSLQRLLGTLGIVLVLDVVAAVLIDVMDRDASTHGAARWIEAIEHFGQIVIAAVLLLYAKRYADTLGVAASNAPTSIQPYIAVFVRDIWTVIKASFAGLVALLGLYLFRCVALRRETASDTWSYVGFLFAVISIEACLVGLLYFGMTRCWNCKCPPSTSTSTSAAAAGAQTASPPALRPSAGADADSRTCACSCMRLRLKLSSYHEGWASGRRGRASSDAASVRTPRPSSFELQEQNPGIDMARNFSNESTASSVSEFESVQECDDSYAEGAVGGAVSSGASAAEHSRTDDSNGGDSGTAGCATPSTARQWSNESTASTASNQSAVSVVRDSSLVV